MLGCPPRSWPPRTPSMESPLPPPLAPLYSHIHLCHHHPDFGTPPLPPNPQRCNCSPDGPAGFAQTSVPTLAAALIRHPPPALAVARPCGRLLLQRRGVSSIFEILAKAGIGIGLRCPLSVDVIPPPPLPAALQRHSFLRQDPLRLSEVEVKSDWKGLRKPSRCHKPPV